MGSTDVYGLDWPSIRRLFELGEAEQRQENVSRILSVLATMGGTAGRVHLRRMARQLRFEDEEAFAELKSRLGDPERALRGLSGQEALLLWGRLTKEERVSLLPLFSAATIREYRLDRGASPVGTKADGPPAKARFFAALWELWHAGRVAAEELWEAVLSIPPCPLGEGGPPALVRLLLLDPLIPPGAMVRLVLLREGFDGQGVRVQVVRDEEGKRPQVAAAAVLAFAGEGVVLWNGGPLTRPGLYRVLVADQEGTPVALGRLAVAHGNPQGLSLAEEERQWERKPLGQACRIRGQLHNPWGAARFDTDIHARLRCACGYVVDETISRFVKGHGEMELFTDGHHGPFHVLFSAQGQTCGLFPLELPPLARFHRPGRVLAALPEPGEQDPFDQVPVSLQADGPFAGLLALFPPQVSPQPLLEALLGPLSRMGTGHYARFNAWAENASRDFVMATPAPLAQVRWLSCFDEYRACLSPPLTRPANHWRLYFFEQERRFLLSQARREVGERAVQHDFPPHLLPADQVKGTLHFSLPRAHTLRINDQEQAVQNGARVEVPLAAAVAITLGGGQKRWEGDWQPRLPHLTAWRVHLLRQGESLEAEEGLLLADLAAWAGLALEGLLDGPAHNVAHTSARIAALFYLNTLIKQGRHTGIHITLAHIPRRLQWELAALHARWPGEDAPPALLALLHRHLAPLAGKGIPVLQQLAASLPPAAPDPLEQALLRARRAAVSAGAVAEVNALLREHIKEEQGRLAGLAPQGSPLGGDGVMAVLLRFLAMLPEGAQGPEHLARVELRQVVREGGFLPKMLEDLRLRKRLREKQQTRHYGRLDDPLWACLAGLAARAEPKGHWGSAATLSLAKAFLAAPRPFAGRFSLDQGREISGVTHPFSGRVTLLSREGLVAVRQRENPLTTHPPAGTLSLGGGTCRLGEDRLLDIQSDGGDFLWVDLLHAGILAVTGIEQGLEEEPGRFRLSLGQGGGRQLAVRLVRRGKATLVGEVHNLHDVSQRGRLVLVVDVV